MSPQSPNKAVRMEQAQEAVGRIKVRLHASFVCEQYWTMLQSKVWNCPYQPCSGTIFLMHWSGIKESSYVIRAVEVQTLFYLNLKPFLLDSFLLSVLHEASRELTVGLILKKTKAAETNLTFTDGFNERTTPHINSYQLQLNTTVDYNICQCKWKIKTTPPFWKTKKFRVLVLALVHGWFWGGVVLILTFLQSRS